MGVAVAVVADVVWAAVVAKVASEVVSRVAVAIGVDPKTANLLGGIAGMAAGAATWGDASSWVRESTGWDTVVNPFVATDGGEAVTEAPTVQEVGGTEAGTEISQVAVEGSGADYSMGDTLNETSGTGALDTGKDTSNLALTGDGIGATAAKGAGESSTMAKMFSSEKTGEIIAGGVSGAAGGYMEGKAIEDAAKAEEESKQAYYDTWRDPDLSTMPSLRYSTPATQQTQVQQPGVSAPQAPRPMLSYPNPVGG